MALQEMRLCVHLIDIKIKTHTHNDVGENSSPVFSTRITLAPSQHLDPLDNIRQCTGNLRRE